MVINTSFLFFRCLFIFLSIVLVSSQLTVSPYNYRYFQYRNKTVALVGSTEHYGAVLNLDFDYVTYLDTLQANGLHLVRTWTGAIYREDVHDFNIRRNTLAPSPGKYLAPWAVEPNSCCYNNTPGVPLYNFSAGWNETYWDRLDDFLYQASLRNIIVNLGLFSNFYGNDSVQWKLSPLYPLNNVNRIGTTVQSANDVFILGLHPDINSLLDTYIAELITRVQKYDNLFYEIINELWTAPYAYPSGGAVYRPWVDHTINFIQYYDNNTHMISENYAIMAKRIIELNSNTSFYSFHDTTLDTLLINENFQTNNRYLLKPLGTGETGFTGDPFNPSLYFTSDDTYRSEGYLTLFNGGVTYNNLDCSFSTLYPNGTDYPIPSYVPGGGGNTLRTSLGVLQYLLDSLPLQYCHPIRNLVTGVQTDGRPQLYYQFSTIGNISSNIGIFAMYITNAWWANGTVNGSFTIEYDVTVSSNENRYTLTNTSSSSSSLNWTVHFINPIDGTFLAPVQNFTSDNVNRLTIRTATFVRDIVIIGLRNDSLHYFTYVPSTVHTMLPVSSQHKENRKPTGKGLS